MWRIYRRTRKDEDYTNYKEAFNAGTTKISKSKRSYEQNFACNINNDSKSFMHTSGVNKRYKVGPLKDSAGNIIAQCFFNFRPKWLLQFSVYQGGYYLLPVPNVKFQEAKSDCLGQLIVTPEMVAKKIKATKDSKSPGVDGIPAKLLMETVEQISISLARVYILSLKEGVVPSEWKTANVIPLFKKGSRNKLDHCIPVSLLLERWIDK